MIHIVCLCVRMYVCVCVQYESECGLRAALIFQPCLDAARSRECQRGESTAHSLPLEDDWRGNCLGEWVPGILKDRVTSPR